MTSLVTGEEMQPLKSQAAYPAAAIASAELSEEYLKLRFSRTAKQAENVVYEVTRDPALLHQYYRLREEMFINVWGLKRFSGHQDDYDDKSDIMIARIGKHCIGGCRLTFKEPGTNEHLPMEKDDFLLSQEMSQLPLDSVRYVEISRLAILPDFQNSVVMLELSRELLKRGAEKKARYAFTLAPVPLARNYRKAASQFGLNWNMLNNVSIPKRDEYEGIKMVLSMLDLAPVYRNKTSKKQQDSANSLVAAID